MRTSLYTTLALASLLAVVEGIEIGSAYGLGATSAIQDQCPVDGLAQIRIEEGGAEKIEAATVPPPSQAEGPEEKKELTPAEKKEAAKKKYKERKARWMETMVKLGSDRKKGQGLDSPFYKNKTTEEQLELMEEFWNPKPELDEDDYTQEELWVMAMRHGRQDEEGQGRSSPWFKKQTPMQQHELFRNLEHWQMDGEDEPNGREGQNSGSAAEHKALMDSFSISKEQQKNRAPDARTERLAREARQKVTNDKQDKLRQERDQEIRERRAKEEAERKAANLGVPAKDQQ